jgi:hypothetical protein
VEERRFSAALTKRKIALASEVNSEMEWKACCDQMQHALESQEIPIAYISKFREYGIRVLDGGPSFIRLNFCPWCSKKLPGSLRETWFHRLDALGIDPAKDAIPPEFSDDRWYSK